jgi:hypothetical protein
MMRGSRAKGAAWWATKALNISNAHYANRPDKEITSPIETHSENWGYMDARGTEAESPQPYCKVTSKDNAPTDQKIMHQR